MSNVEVTRSIEELEAALNILDANPSLEELPPEGLQDLGLAVDNVRKSVWAVLVAEHSGDYDIFLGKLRVRRATEICREVVSDFDDEAITAKSPGLDVFHAALRELAKAFDAGVA